MENGTSTSKQIKDSFPPNKQEYIDSVITDFKLMDFISDTVSKTIKVNNDYI